jgi:mannose/fructose-specific phosphotransferase system component IIA
MKASYASFIICHQDLAYAFIETVEKIIGPQKNTYTYSNKHDSLPILAQKISDNINKVAAEHTVIFVDLKGGSCWNLACLLKREFPATCVISGISLPMLITYYSNMEHMSFRDLIAKVYKDGCRAINSQLGK